MAKETILLQQLFFCQHLIEVDVVCCCDVVCQCVCGVVESLIPIPVACGKIVSVEGEDVGMGPPVGVGIGSLPVTPKINGEIGAMCVESGLAGVAQHNKT